MTISASIQDNVMKVELTIRLRGSMLEPERAIMTALNEAGARATKELLQQFDTAGSPIEPGGVRWTSKGREWKYYQTPYGQVMVNRHVYQTSEGGKTFCPLAGC